MSGDFLQLVGLSVLLAVPVAWYFTRQWLQNFAHRIDLQWWVFVGVRPGLSYRQRPVSQSSLGQSDRKHPAGVIGIFLILKKFVCIQSE